MMNRWLRDGDGPPQTAKGEHERIDDKMGGVVVINGDSWFCVVAALPTLHNHDTETIGSDRTKANLE